MTTTKKRLILLRVDPIGNKHKLRLHRKWIGYLAIIWSTRISYTGRKTFAVPGRKNPTKDDIH